MADRSQLNRWARVGREIESFLELFHQLETAGHVEWVPTSKRKLT